MPLPPARNALLFLALVGGATAVYFHQQRFLDPARPLLALAAFGWIFARPSDRPLRTWLWAALVAIELGLAQSWASLDFALWLVCTFVGAALAIRAGSRSMAYLLPEAENETGVALQSRIRRQLVIAVLVFVTVYVWDGGLEPAAPAWARSLALFVAAAFFVRYLLLQSKYLGIAAGPLGRSNGLVASQRWPFLVLIFTLAATPYPARWLGPEGDGPLLLTSALLFVLAGLLYALALARSGWPKQDVRRMSFFAGIGLAFALASVVAELQGATPERYTFFGAFAMAFLLVAPFVRATTKLFDTAPVAERVIAPTYIAVMAAPVTAASAFWRVSALRGALLAFAVLVTAYFVAVAFRNERGDFSYPLASLGCVVAAAVFPVGGAWEVFALSLCFVLYAIDVRQRIRGVSPGSGS